MNAVQLPELAHLVDPIMGGVCVGGQILLFKPWSHHQKVKDAKAGLIEGSAKSRGLEGAASKISERDGYRAAAGADQKIGSRDVVIQAEDPADIGDGANGVEDLVAS